jgi:hypothetical protein
MSPVGAPSSVRLAATVPTFVLVVVLVSLIFGNKHAVPLISGVLAMWIVEIALDIAWFRRRRRSR